MRPREHCHVGNPREKPEPRLDLGCVSRDLLDASACHEGWINFRSRDLLAPSVRSLRILVPINAAVRLILIVAR
jgi:hypothetical protein